MKPEILKAFARYNLATKKMNAKEVSSTYGRSLRWAQQCAREVRAEGYSIDGDEKTIEAHRVEALSSIDDGDNQDRDMETDPWSISEPVSKSWDAMRKVDAYSPLPGQTSVQPNVDEHDQVKIDGDPSATESTNDRSGSESVRIESPEYNETTNVDSTPIDEQDQPKNNGPEKPSNDDEPKSLKTVATEFLHSESKSEIDWSNDVTEKDVLPPYAKSDIEFSTNILKDNRYATFGETSAMSEEGEKFLEGTYSPKEIGEYSEGDVKFAAENRQQREEKLTQVTNPPQSPWLLSLTSKASAVIVALVAGIASYIHIVSVALQSGEDYFVAHIIPFSLDGLIIVATMAMLEDKRNGQKPRIVARAALIVGIIGTLAANVASAGAGLPAEAVAVIPAVAFLLSVEVLVSGGKKAA